MEKFITNTKSIFFQWQTLGFLLLYFFLRFFSFLIRDNLFIQAGIVFILLMILGIIYFKKPEWSWYIVLAELFLGGSGHYLEFFGLSVRTLFILFFLFLWFSHSLGEKTLKHRLKINKELLYLLIAWFFFLGVSTVLAIFHGHALVQIIKDILPFSFLLLIFPAFHLFSLPKSQEYLARLLLVFIIGTALFSIFTFALFSTGTAETNHEFYSWYQDINMGIITDMGQGFFRIVEPEHLLIVPFMLILVSLLMRWEKHHFMWRILLFLSTIILTINLSRGYFLALLVGLLVLKYKHSWKKWLTESILTILMVIITFTGVHCIASGGTSLGLDLFGLRIKSFNNPQIEVSTDTRMMVLPAITTLIKQNPIVGIGPGAEVTFINTATYKKQTTSYFDWGYLEMWAETGILGLISLTLLYLFTIYLLINKIRNINDWHDFDVGLLAGLVAFLVMNITIAALFHVFGILFLIFSLTIALKHTSIFERTTTILYQTFNRIK